MSANSGSRPSSIGVGKGNPGWIIGVYNPMSSQLCTIGSQVVDVNKKWLALHCSLYCTPGHLSNNHYFVACIIMLTLHACVVSAINVARAST